MNRYISIIVVLFVSVVISFCTKDYDVESLLVETPVEFTSSGIAPSRVTINDEWEQGDEVGIYMMESESGVTLEQNIRYGVNSGEGTSFATFSPLDGGAITYPGSGVIVDFLCYYPYTRSDVDGTVVIANAGTDLLISQVSGKGSGEVVNFGFDHVMSKVAIVVTANDDLADLGGLGDLDVIINNVCSYSQYDMLNDTFTAVDDAATTSLTFDVVLDGNNSATVSTILIPGSYDNVIEFSVGERSYYANFTATLASGECGNFTAVLGNDNVVFDIDNIVDWASGASGDVGTSLLFDNWIDVAAEQFDFGDGSQSNPWLVSNGYQLAKLAADLQSGVNDYEGEYILLTDDIDLLGAEWSAIGGEKSPFKGTFLGKNYYISGMTITNSTGGAGLFGYLSGATIENVGIVDCNISINYANVGGLVGYASNSTSISSCFVTGTIGGGSLNVGGLVGYGEDLFITESFSSVELSGNNQSFYVGGLVGYSKGGLIFHSNNLGSVKGCSYVGGIVGCCDGSKIVTCYNSGEVGVADFAQGSVGFGGVAGEVKSGTIFASYNTADVDLLSTATVVGGVIGSLEGDNIVTSCYNSGVVSGSGLFGGVYSDQIACYYVGVDGDEGSAVESIAALNDELIIDQMNNQIELWNLYNETQVLYYYVAGADDDTPPSFAGGVTDVSDVEDWSTMAAPRFASGSGTDSDPYIISNGYELARLAVDVQDGQSYDGKYFNLSDDIDLMGGEWIKIGSQTCHFKGNFDGNNRGISDFKITSDEGYIGLFGYVSGASIHDLSVSGFDISGSTSVGALVGQASNNSTITNCHVDGTVYGSSDLVGGLVGYLVDSVVEECSSAGGVTGNGDGYYYVGGLVGYACDSDDVDDTEVVNSFNIASVDGGTYTGGVLGGATDSDSYSHYRGVTIYGCYNSGTITSTSTHTSYAGGVAGRFYDSQMVACYNIGEVNATGYGGGLIGCVHVNATTTRISNFFGCYNLGTVTGTTSSDALFGRSDISGVNMVQDCYYVDGSQTGGYGEICTDISSKVDYLNNAIAYWNYNCARKYYYVYGSGSVPALSAGTPIFHFDNWSNVVSLAYAGGSGTESDPYQISDGYQLAKLAGDVADGESYGGKYFVITKEIDLESIEWTPIGGVSHAFQGYFDGGSLSVTNLKISGSSSYMGLFGCLSGATIESVTISGSDLSGGGFVGTLAGQAVANTTITDCHVDGIKVYGSGDLVGGMVGSLSDSVVDECSSAGTVTGNSGGSYYVGGLVGYASDSDDVDDTEVVNSSNAASVVDGTYTGGVLGGATDSDQYNHFRGVTIYGCHNSGTITSASTHTSYAGGVAGRFYDSQMLACYNSGEINATGYAGGLIGCVHVNATTSRMSNFFGCYSVGSATGTTSSDALFSRSDISGVNTVLDCYYVGGSQTNGYGESCADISALNDKIDYLNNAIAYWNQNILRQYEYIYVEGADGPTLTEGSGDMYFDSWSDVPALIFDGGSGDEGDPYLINDGYQLAKLSKDVKDGETYEGKYFRITDNIDLEGKLWSPIGRDGYIFYGTVDGGSHTISNLTIEESGGSVGLFGYINESSIFDLTVSGYDVSGSICVGALVGRADLSYINNCHVAGVESTLSATSDYVGGLIGYNVDSSVANCSSEGIISGPSYVGGLIGYAYQRTGDDDIEIFNCHNSATVKSGTYVGGLLGGAADDDVETYKRGISIYCSHNSGEITIGDSGVRYAGGIAGRFHDGQMVGCYNWGSVTNSSGYAGGLIGCVHVNVSTKTSGFYGCYNSGVISGSTSSEALFGTTTSLEMVKDCYYLSPATDSDSSGLGVAASSLSELNSDESLSYLNNGIATWNVISVRDINYIYTSGSDGPTLISGTPEVIADYWVDIAAAAYGGGSGTSGSPYQIANVEQLAKLSKDVAGGTTYEGVYFEITDDINLMG
ncbi:MAG: fimbrillin family protein, partial [Rikenellaceae bacterium]